MVENLREKFTLGILNSIKGQVAKVQIGDKEARLFVGHVREAPERKAKYSIGQQAGLHGVVRAIQWNGNDYEYECVLHDLPPHITWVEESQI